MTVPNGYFDRLAGEILQQAKNPPAKVVGINQVSNLLKFAVAAMMTGIVALALYKYIDNPPSQDGIVNSNAVAKLDATIERGKNMNDLQFNKILEDLSGADIAKYLDRNGDISDVSILRNNLNENNFPEEEEYLMDATTLETFIQEIEKTTLNN